MLERINKFAKFMFSGSFLLVWFKWFVFANILTFLLLWSCDLMFVLPLKSFLAINAYSTLIPTLIRKQVSE